MKGLKFDGAELKRQFIIQWNSYAAGVIAKTAGNVQKKETKLAFYTGGFLSLQLMSRMLRDENISEKLCVKELANLESELLSAVDFSSEYRTNDKKH